MFSKKPFTVRSLISILVEPISNSVEGPTLLTKLQNGVMKELLIVGIDRWK